MAGRLKKGVRLASRNKMKAGACHLNYGNAKLQLNYIRITGTFADAERHSGRNCASDIKQIEQPGAIY